MICPDCGMQNPDNAAYCDCCGCKLTPSAPVPAPETPGAPAPQATPAASPPVAPVMPASTAPSFQAEAAPTPPTPPTPPAPPVNSVPKTSGNRNGIIIAIIIGCAIIIGALIVLFGLMGSKESGETEVIETVAPSIPEAESPQAGPEYMSFEWLMENACTVPLDHSDLTGFSSQQLRLIRNSIYARHGRRFKDRALQDYFDSMPWYSGTRSEVSLYELSDTERNNITVIQEMER